MTNEVVDDVEEKLRAAESYVEEACRLLGNEPLNTDLRREVWNSMKAAITNIQTAIHGAYDFRPFDEGRKIHG